MWDFRSGAHRPGQYADRYQYLRTAGDPEGGAPGADVIHQTPGRCPPGSGRHRLRPGALAASSGQTPCGMRLPPKLGRLSTGRRMWIRSLDRKRTQYISLRGGQVADFQITGSAPPVRSFVEEQAARMGIPLAEFSLWPSSAPSAVGLGERCTVFIETVQSALSGLLPGRGGGWPVPVHCPQLPPQGRWGQACRKPRVLQGSVTYNPGIVAAFQQVGAAHSFTCFPSAAPMERPCWR